MRIDIGCGGRGSRWGGFLGIDLFDEAELSPQRTKQEYMKFDIVKDDLPREWIGACDEVVALHVVEHLDRDKAHVLISKCLFMLQPRGLLFLTCPDLAKLCRHYLERDHYFWYQRHTDPAQTERWPGETLADRFNHLCHENGHRWCYDLDTLLLLARSAGFSDVRPIPTDSRYYSKPDHECGILAIR